MGTLEKYFGNRTKSDELEVGSKENTQIKMACATEWAVIRFTEMEKIRTDLGEGKISRIPL